jgi:hypothetical protein
MNRVYILACFGISCPLKRKDKKKDPKPRITKKSYMQQFFFLFYTFRKKQGKEFRPFSYKEELQAPDL